MKQTVCLCVVMCWLSSGFAQQVSTATAVAANSGVPALISFRGTLTDANGKPLTTVLGVTFLLYKDSQGGTPLWMETQNVHPDKAGHYSVMLGSTTSQGLPQDVFASGEARWLGVQILGEQEQPRVLLVAVPYALKAGDAETVGGLPPSAFVLANSAQANRTGTKSAVAPDSTAPGKNAAPPADPNVTGKGVVDFIPMWDTNRDIIDSLIFQKSGEIGINTTVPAATLDINGKGDVRDTLTLFPKGTDSTLAISGTTFKVDQTGKVDFVAGQTFPGAGTITGVTTATGSGLSGGGTTGPLNLSLMKTCSARQVLQWNGTAWACSAAGTGTITAVTTASGSGLQGGGTGGALNLSLNSAVVPELATANKFTNTNTVSVSSNSSPALTLANHTGNGLNISDAGTNGIYIASTGNGIVMASVVGDGIDIQGAAASGISAIGHNDGGYFNGRVAGSYAQNDVDGNGSAAAYGYETGSTNVTYGVVGFSASNKGIGTYGQAVSGSVQGSTFAGATPFGVWGDSGAPNGTGVVASADSGYAIVALNNSDGVNTAIFENNENASSSDGVLTTFGGGFGGKCTIDVSGSLSCNGTVTAVVPTGGGSRQVALNAISSAESWFEDAGSSQLSNGKAVVNIESAFGETVNTGIDYHVFLTPNGDCKGLYVARKSPTSFVVRELGGGTASVAFDYRIMAKRKGFEQIRLADKTKEMNAPLPKRAEGPRPVMPTAQEIRAQQEAHLHRTRFAKSAVN
jgi:hypothetical protein